MASLPSTAMKRMHALPMTVRSPKSRTGTTKPIEAAKNILSSQCSTRFTCAVPAISCVQAACGVLIQSIR